MRDVVVFLLFVTLLPSCFLRPWWGVMAFTWLAYNRTQDLTWGFARSLPISDSIAVAMILGWMAWEYRPLWFSQPRLRAMVLLVLVVGVSMGANELIWEAVGKRYSELVKIVFVALLTGALLVNRARLRAYFLVVALALGFYGIKNGLWFLAGQGTIVGPGGMLKDNNDFALAMVMNLPLLWYVSYDVSDLRGGRALRLLLRGTFGLTVVAIMATGSRGGFLAMVACTGMMTMKTRYKVPALVSAVLVGLLALALAPPEYRERLSSITEAADQSAQGRILSWKVALNMIEHNPVLGIGFNNFVYQYQRYLTGIELPYGMESVPSRVAHNSYLQIWAESGSIAFGLFLFLVFGTILSMRRLQRAVRGTGDDWILRYATAIETTLYGYLAGAMFLNRAHFDLMYQLVAVGVMLPVVIVAERERQAALRRRRLGPAVPSEVWVRHRDPFVKLPSA